MPRRKLTGTVTYGASLLRGVTRGFCYRVDDTAVGLTVHPHSSLDNSSIV